MRHDPRWHLTLGRSIGSKLLWIADGAAGLAVDRLADSKAAGAAPAERPFGLLIGPAFQKPSRQQHRWMVQPIAALRRLQFSGPGIELARHRLRWRACTRAELVGGGRRPQADILRVKEWRGRADVQTTMRYLQFVQRPDDAALVNEAFAIEALSPGGAMHQAAAEWLVREG